MDSVLWDVLVCHGGVAPDIDRDWRTFICRVRHSFWTALP